MRLSRSFRLQIAILTIDEFIRPEWNLNRMSLMGAFFALNSRVLEKWYEWLDIGKGLTRWWWISPGQDFSKLVRTSAIRMVRWRPAVAQRSDECLLKALNIFQVSLSCLLDDSSSEGRNSKANEWALFIQELQIEKVDKKRGCSSVIEKRSPWPEKEEYSVARW